MRNQTMYEDSYSGCEYDTFEELWGSIEEYLIGECAGLNWPVWIERNDSGLMELGIFMQRHGVSAIWIAPSTDKQYRQVQDMMTEVWIGRIDAGYPRKSI